MKAQCIRPLEARSFLLGMLEAQNKDGSLIQES
jgi:hypothetical protein